MSNNNYVNKRNNELNIFDEDESFFTSFLNAFGRDSSKLMKTDVKETENEYIIYIDVPGYRKDEIKLSLDQKYLTVTATTSQEKDEKEKNVKFIRQERFYGTCSRSYFVGDIEQKDIKASFENGVLKIVLAKKHYQKAAEKKYIDIN